MIMCNTSYMNIGISDAHKHKVVITDLLVPLSLISEFEIDTQGTLFGPACTSWHFVDALTDYMLSVVHNNHELYPFLDCVVVLETMVPQNICKATYPSVPKET
jgi:hypothetical protein